VTSYKPGSLKEMDRLIKRIRESRSAIRFFRSQLRQGNDAEERQNAIDGIVGALLSIETASACLYSDAHNCAEQWRNKKP